MKCIKCPMFEEWNNESDSGAACGIFGDEWHSRFQYEDKEGTIIGCYIERAYILKAEKAYYEELDNRVEYFLNEEDELDDEEDIT